MIVTGVTGLLGGQTNLGESSGLYNSASSARSRGNSAAM